MTLGPNSTSTGLRVTLLAIAALALIPSSANAGSLIDNAVSCYSYNLEQPFERWGDPFSYQLAPDGAFEHRARGWTLTGGAKVVRGNESFFVHRRSDFRSLSLPAGSSATSPPMCIAVNYPTLRTFAIDRRSNPLSMLKVEVLYEDALGVIQDPLLIGLLPVSKRWDATLPATLLVNVLTLLPPDNSTAVAFRFSPQDAGDDLRIDDVYVDPYRTR